MVITVEGTKNDFSSLITAGKIKELVSEYDLTTKYIDNFDFSMLSKVQFSYALTDILVASAKNLKEVQVKFSAKRWNQVFRKADVEKFLQEVEKMCEVFSTLGFTCSKSPKKVWYDESTDRFDTEYEMFKFVIIKW